MGGPLIRRCSPLRLVASPGPQGDENKKKAPDAFHPSSPPHLPAELWIEGVGRPASSDRSRGWTDLGNRGAAGLRCRGLSGLARGSSGSAGLRVSPAFLVPGFRLCSSHYFFCVVVPRLFISAGSMERFLIFRGIWSDLSLSFYLSQYFV